MPRLRVRTSLLVDDPTAFKTRYWVLVVLVMVWSVRARPNHTRHVDRGSAGQLFTYHSLKGLEAVLSRGHQPLDVYAKPLAEHFEKQGSSST